jgi:hypothetical protein
MKTRILFLLTLLLIAGVTRAQWNQYWTGQSDAGVNQIFSVVNDSVIWMPGTSSNTVSITLNKGKTWTVFNLPSFLSGNIGGLSAVNTTTAYAICMTGDEKGLYKTTDNGTNWILQSTAFNASSPFPDFVYFWDANNGVAVGDASPNENFEIYTTSNGGTQWNKVLDGSMPGGNFEATVANFQDSHKVKGDTFYFVTNRGRIFKSEDKGITWSVINPPVVSSQCSFEFKDRNNGLFADESKQPARLYSTSNGGQNWALIDTTDIIGQLRYIPNQNLYISTSTDTSKMGLLYSGDNGLHWTPNLSLAQVGLGPCEISPDGTVYITGADYIFSTKDVTSAIDTLATAATHLFSFSPTGGTINLKIAANTNWEIKSDQQWVSFSSSSGSANKTITITVTDNPLFIIRQASLILSAKGLGSQTIIVNQDVKPYLEVSSSILTIGAQENSTNTFDVNSNQNLWTISCDQNWLTVSNFDNANNNGFNGTYKATGIRIHPTAGILTVNILNEYLATIDSVTFQKNYAGDINYQTQIQLTDSIILVDGKTMLKVRVAITDPNVLSGSGMLSTDHDGNSTNYYDPEAKTFNLSYFYNNAAPRNIYEKLVRDIVGYGYQTINIIAKANPTQYNRTAKITLSANYLADQIVTVTQDAGPTGIHVNENQQILFYPNPVQSVLFINGIATNTLVSVYDVTGLLVVQKRISENKIDISNLASGYYMLKLVEKNDLITYKFIKQ